MPNFDWIAELEDAVGTINDPIVQAAAYAAISAAIEASDERAIEGARRIIAALDQVDEQLTTDVIRRA